MNLFERFLYFLQGEMNTPKPFGWFHLMCIFWMVLFIIILFIYKEKNNDKQLRLVLGIYSIIALILELLKQLIWSFNLDTLTGVVTWDYQWYAFPFQLCTMPIYVCIAALFLKKGKIRDHLLSFVSYVTILGSIATIFIPDSCFTRYILINIHTMWLHLGSFVVSIYLLMSGEVLIKFDNLKKAIKTFLVFVFFANLLNIIIYNIGILNGETFNMFYISPYFISTLPVFDIIQQSVPYIIYLCIYILVIITGSVIIYRMSVLLNKLRKK